MTFCKLPSLNAPTPVYRYKREKKLSLQIFQIVKNREAEGDEMIHNPLHYVAGRRIQPIRIIENWNLNHHLACALKYISRAGRKHDELKDLKKAVWYVQRRIRLLEQHQT